MLSVGIRDIDAVPPRPRGVLGYFRQVARSLTTGRRERGRARVRTAAAVGHAISFVTWHSLVREGSLTSEEAADLMRGDGRRGGGMTLRVSERCDDGHRFGFCSAVRSARAGVALRSGRSPASGSKLRIWSIVVLHHLGDET